MVTQLVLKIYINYILQNYQIFLLYTVYFTRYCNNRDFKNAIAFFITLRHLKYSNERLEILHILCQG